MQENKITTPILAIHPGRRKMGVAVLEGDELLFWGVTGFREKEVRELLDGIKKRVQSLIQIYQPGMLAVERPHATRLKASPALEMIVERISAVAVDSSLYFCLYDALTIRRFLCGQERATRRQMIERIVTRYPHLARYAAPGVSRWQESYWQAMFAAVGVGMVCTNNT